jgi:uncharacterized RDD family membrane protein YckC
VKPLSKPEARATFGVRLGAFVVDAILLGVALTFVHRALVAILAPLARGATPPYGDGWWGWFPWGYHDETLPLWEQVLIGLASAAIVMAYYTWLEGREGRSLGKRALDLRVMRTDGEPMTYREAFLRNATKLVPPLLFLEAILLLLAGSEKRQRLSDKIAGTVVVRA